MLLSAKLTVSKEFIIINDNSSKVCEKQTCAEKYYLVIMFTQTPYDFALNVFDFFLFEVRVTVT